MDRRGWPWIVDDSRAAIVAIGDVLVIGAIIAYGLSTHEVAPTTEPRYFLQTVAPFWTGWFVAAAAVGAYSKRVLTGVMWGIAGTTGAWIVAVVIGASLRASPLVPGNAPPIFVAVTFAVGLLGLLPWRVLVSFRGGNIYHNL